MNKISYFTRLLGNLYEYQRKRVHCSFLPTGIFLEPTNICNLECVMCPNKELPESKKGSMNFSVFKKVIDEASSFAVHINLFLTGEPLLHPEILGMISYIKSHGLMVKIHTNGTLLTKNLSEKLITSEADILSISFDGYNADTYNSIRKKSDFQKTLEKVKGFLEIKKSLNSNKPFTIIQTLMMDEKEFSSDNREKFKKIFDGLPVNRFSAISPIRWPGQDMDIPGAPARNVSRKFHPCIDPWFTMNVLWNGDVVPCCGDFSGAYVMGNVADRPLRNIWNNDRMVSLRENLTGAKPLSVNLCKNCDRLFEERVLGFPIRNLKYFIKERLPYVKV